jgi:hypothetical protein
VVIPGPRICDPGSQDQDSLFASPSPSSAISASSMRAWRAVTCLRLRRRCPNIASSSGAIDAVAEAVMFVVGIYHELNAEQRRSRSLASLADVYEPNESLRVR